VFFHLAPPHALLGDSNGPLVAVYRAVRESPDLVMAALDRHQPLAGEADYYYQLRAQDPAALDAVEAAARFIFLNKTCYNGLYRVNRQGRFNVPFGRYRTPPQLYDRDAMLAASAALRGARLETLDFAETMAVAGPGDLVYLDPPYDPLSVTANFTGYTATSFSRPEQERLAAAFREAAARGARLVLNNSDTEFIRSLYRGFRCVAVPGLRRAINSDPSKRAGVTELVITSG
jgi:DNA adenine methylase